MKAVYKATGKLPEQLANQPPLPRETAYLWQWFLELSTPAPLTFTEIAAWCKLTSRELSSLEVSVIKKLDSIFRQVQNE